MKKLLVLVFSLMFVLGLTATAMAEGFDGGSPTDCAGWSTYDPFIFDNLGDCVSGFTCSDFTSDICRYWRRSDSDALPSKSGLIAGESTSNIEQTEVDTWISGNKKNQGDCVTALEEEFICTLTLLDIHGKCDGEYATEDNIALCESEFEPHSID